MPWMKHSLRSPSPLNHQTLRRLSCSARRLAREVRVVEVGPRDGLQNEKSTISLSTKIELLKRLAGTGVKDIEAGSFVAPKWVPQVCSPPAPTDWGRTVDGILLCGFRWPIPQTFSITYSGIHPLLLTQSHTTFSFQT